MRILLISILLGITVSFASSKEKLVKNTFTADIGGTGKTVSVNYDRLLYSKNKHKIQIGAGLGYFPMYVNNKAALGTFNFSVSACHLYSFSRHHLVAGVTNCISYSADDVSDKNKYNKTSYELSPTVGYRYQNFLNSGFVFKFNYSPIITFEGIGIKYKTVFYKHYFCIGFGYGF